MEFSKGVEWANNSHRDVRMGRRGIDRQLLLHDIRLQRMDGWVQDWMGITMDMLFTLSLCTAATV